LHFHLHREQQARTKACQQLGLKRQTATSRPHTFIFFVDVTVTSARTTTNAPQIGARLLLRGSHTLGAQHCKLYVDLRTSTFLGTPSVQSVHDYYPFALEDGDRLAPMVVELIDRLVIWWQFFASLAWVQRTLVHCCLIVVSACDIFFVYLLLFPFDSFGGIYGENLCNVFLLLFMVLWVLIFAMLFGMPSCSSGLGF
jgi:hypothetical protein